MKKGFTLVELLIVGTLISVILSVGLVSTSDMVFETGLRNQTQDVETALRKAQAAAVTNRGDNPAGVRIEEDRYILFEGRSYAERVAPLDRTSHFTVDMTIPGTDEVVFEQTTGRPLYSEDGTTIILQYGESMQEIKISPEGKIESSL